jgi:hypothetical protein
LQVAFTERRAARESDLNGAQSTISISSHSKMIFQMLIVLVFIVSANKRSANDESMDKNAFEELKRNLGFSERKVYSQNGEDGVLIFLQIQGIIKVKNGYYVEFGVEDGMERNTREVNERCNFTGLLMDGSNENPKINLHKEWIYSYNINQLFRKYDVPKEFDILSIDLDSFDYFVWKVCTFTFTIFHTHPIEYFLCLSSKCYYYRNQFVFSTFNCCDSKGMNVGFLYIFIFRMDFIIRLHTMSTLECLSLLHLDSPDRKVFLLNGCILHGFILRLFVILC